MRNPRYSIYRRLKINNNVCMVERQRERERERGRGGGEGNKLAYVYVSVCTSSTFRCV